MDSLDNGSFKASEGIGSATGQRGRDSLFLMAELRLGGQTLGEIRVRNLSEGGLMAELERPVEPGTPIEIKVRGLGWVSGQVAWYTEGRAGVAFDAPIDPKRARKPVGQGTTTPYFAKPVIGHR